MKTRKHKLVDKFKRTFFLTGLIGALFITHTALTYKTFYQSDFEFPSSEEPIEFTTDAIITHRELPKLAKAAPKKQKQAISLEVRKIWTPIIEPGLIDDSSTEDDDVVWDIIPDTGDPDADEKIQAWKVLDRKPIFKGCESLNSEKERTECFEEKIRKHVTDNFDIKETWGIAENVHVHFVIDSKGKVTDILCTRGDDENKNEAVRVIEKLPDFVPARYKGKDVSTRFTLPIAIVK